MRDTESFAVMEVLSREGISKKRRVSASSDSSIVELEDHTGFFVDSPDIVVYASNFENSGGVVPGESSCSGEVVKCTLAKKDEVSSLVELEDHPGFFFNSQDIVVSASNFVNSGDFFPDGSSCSSSGDESGRIVKCTLAYEDDESRNREMIKSEIAYNSKFSQRVQLREYSEEAHSPAKKPSSKSRRRTFQVGKTPPKIEIEAFFAEAEKYETKRFAVKYNFDIVNDEPLEGRYLWIPLKH